MTDEQQLLGGVANAGRVTRVGDHVLRPANEHSESIHRFLTALRATGFEGASLPVGIDADGRERLEFIAGDVAIPPYPEWVQPDRALASLARLMRRFHDASRAFDPAGCTWSMELGDPAGGPVMCHNDVCLENVVFRAGEAVGLLDFDFVTPGIGVYDLANMARMCVPVDDDVSAGRLGWTAADRPARLRLVSDAYGLDPGTRQELVVILDNSIRRGGAFVRRRVEAGDPNFIKMWDEFGGAERFDRRRRWWDRRREDFCRALA